MSSSSSDSDSDDFEPIRKIKINIRPKEDVVRGCSKGAADVNEIKASVEAWRPLGPPTHPSLSRRQSSLSSVSSISFGASGSGSGLSVGPTSINNSGVQNSGNIYATTRPAHAGPAGAGLVTNSTIRSSPSCSSLVDEFYNRSSFSNFMSATTSRTSSPLTLIPYGDSSVPIAIAIQESIELIVKGHYDPNAIEPKFQSRSLGNIKIAFPNAFAKGSYGKLNPVLKLRLHSTENIIKYYASRLIKDLDLGTTQQNLTDQSTDAFFHNSKQRIDANNDSINGEFKSNINSKLSVERPDLNQNSFDDFGTTTYDKNFSKNSKLIEFDIDILMCHLKKLYNQSPASKYYNVDVLRYQIAPIQSIVECPLQVCAYWKIEPKMVKLRIDFKHSNKSGFNLERLRELSFCVDFAGFIPSETDINSLSPDSLSTIRLNNNNNSGAFDMNSSTMARPREDAVRPESVPDFNVKLVPPPITARTSVVNNMKQPSSKLHSYGHEIRAGQDTSHSVCDQGPQRLSMGLLQNISGDPVKASERYIAPSSIQQPKTPPCHTKMPPYITYEPQAHWNNSIKQLMWKFDTLLSYHKTDGLGSLFAKLDFRNHHGMPPKFLEKCTPTPVEVRFLVTDSTLSKISMSIDSIGYKMSLLKKEIRSGRYRSEPYVL